VKSTQEMLLWQDVRARAIDQQLGGDRRYVGERVASWFRWVFLIVFTLMVGAAPSPPVVIVVAPLIVVAALANLALSLALMRRWRPNRWVTFAILVIDFGLGSAMLLIAQGAGNPVVLAWYLVVIAGAIRSGSAAAVLVALGASLEYGIALGLTSLLPALGQVFLFVTVALVVAIMTRELERERRIAITRAAQADTMREMSVTMDSSLYIQDVFSVVLERAMRMTGAERGGLILVSDDSIEVAAGEELDPDLARDLARRGEPEFREQRSQLLVPLASGEGVAAILWLGGRHRTFSNQDLFTVNALAGSAAVPLANALGYQRSAQEAITDGLTGLLNHREFRRRLEQEVMLRTSIPRPMAVMIIDLDHFKEVNDSMGHQHGDEVIRSAGRLVRTTARAHDLVARYGGDELAVILPDSGLTGSTSLAERLIAAVHAAGIRTTPARNLTLTIGLACMPDDALSADELVMAADQALYLAKREGRDRYMTTADLVNRLAEAEQVLLKMLGEVGPQLVVAAGHALDRRLGTPRRSSLVAAVAEAVGRRAGVAADFESLRAAAFLQDVGSLGSTQSDGARAVQGERLLSLAGFPAPVPRAVRHHHERWDGGGKPDGLRETATPVEARLVGLASEYERLVSGRDGLPLTPSEAALKIAAQGGAHEPALVAALRSLADEQKLPAPPILAAV
jgi:diguanylate cyclase (GGDEF)-like protein